MKRSKRRRNYNERLESLCKRIARLEAFCLFLLILNFVKPRVSLNANAALKYGGNEKKGAAEDKLRRKSSRSAVDIVERGTPKNNKWLNQVKRLKKTTKFKKLVSLFLRKGC